MATQDDVLRLVAEVLNEDRESLELAHHFVRDLGVSSLDIVELVMRIEQHYALGETPDSELEHIETIGDLVELVRSLRGHNEPSVVEELLDLAIASDHAGVALKAELIEWCRAQGYSLVDLGPASSDDSVDYPDFAQLVCDKVRRGEVLRGVLVCGSGIGMSIAANKITDIRAAMVSEPISARLSRLHNDANVICLGARMIGPEIAKACMDAFMVTEFTPGEDGRHRRRIRRAMELGRDTDR